MAHEVENMFYVGQTPWHGLGIPLEDPPTMDDAIRLAGLNWTVDVQPLRLPAPINRESQKARVVLRSTDCKELGVVGMDYTPLQNADAFNWFQPFVEQKLATLHTAGSLRGGERVWILAKLNAPNSEIVKGDEVAKFILLSNGHDGKMAVRVGFTPVRVVCANTMAFAHHGSTSQLIRVRHTAQVKTAVEDLREVMDTVNSQFEATAEQYRYLASKGCNENDLQRYLNEVFQKIESVVPAKEDKKRLYNQIVPLFQSGRGNDMKGVSGTWYGAYNAVSEYLTWERGRDADTRLNSLWFQNGLRTNRRALDAALKLAA